MKHKTMPFCYGIFVFLCCSLSSAEEIKYTPYVTHHVNDDNNYYVSMLKLVLEHTPGAHKMLPVELPMSQRRIVRSLLEKHIDIMWSTTSKEMENIALPVRVPLLKGLLGYRIFIITKPNQSLFSADMGLSKIKSLMAIQGDEWLDTAVLKINGFKVEGTPWVSSIFKTLEEGHVDYFPRSIIEANTEINLQNSEHLTVEKHILLHYPLAVYFFVHKDNTALATLLENGLRTVQANGKFDTLLLEHPDHKAALANADLGQRTLFSIPNPLMPDSIPQDPAMWLNINNL